jgi:hypothetical protein
MQFRKFAVATTELLLIFPATIFMTALFVQQVVNWFAARPRGGLWGLLIALPLAVLVTGSATLLHGWNHETELRHAARDTLAVFRRHLTTLLVASATCAAGGILAIVTLHVLTD